MSLSLLAALLEGEGQIVQTSRRFFLAVGSLVVFLGGRPVISGCRVGVLAADTDLISGSYVGSLGQTALSGRLLSRFGVGLDVGEGGKDIGWVVQLDEFRRVLDNLGLADPLAGRLVEEAAAAAETQIRGDGQVVNLVVDQNQPAQIGDPTRVGIEELAQLC